MRVRSVRSPWRLLIPGSVLLCLAACGTGAGLVQPGFAERREAPGIDNFARINEGIFRGAQPDDEGLRWLKEQGFRTIINLRGEYDERERVEALGMQAVRIGLRAGVWGSTPPTRAQIDEFFEIVNDPANQPVFFHCRKGRDRVGTMAALLRLQYDAWERRRAIDEMQYFGFNDYFRDLKRTVKTYEPAP